MSPSTTHNPKLEVELADVRLVENGGWTQQDHRICPDLVGPQSTGREGLPRLAGDLALDQDGHHIIYQFAQFPWVPQDELLNHAILDVLS